MKALDLHGTSITDQLVDSKSEEPPRCEVPVIRRTRDQQDWTRLLKNCHVLARWQVSIARLEGINKVLWGQNGKLSEKDRYQQCREHKEQSRWGQNKTKLDIKSKEDEGEIQVDKLQDKVSDAAGLGGPVFGAGKIWSYLCKICAYTVLSSHVMKDMF
ncbi:unnamed protein product [Arabidopsis lyrata]|nr:unnamed protein product [Arabidopsis lyrata]